LSYSFEDIDVVLIEIMCLDIFRDLAGYPVPCHAYSHCSLLYTIYTSIILPYMLYVSHMWTSFSCLLDLALSQPQGRGRGATL